MQGAVETFQGIEDDQPLLFAGRFGFGQVGQAFEIGPLQGTAAELVDHQAAGDAAEVGARFFERRQLTGAQQADEGILGQVGGVLLTTDPAA
ncbi:hypothetical protein D3C78_1364860 [compost metagenome]